ncbi:MAG TPA: hypothetical protein VGV35_09730 [Bryobacteraceae bacterium]|nr:hypothetical protein [Bryobacteraceae bacterium]
MKWITLALMVSLAFAQEAKREVREVKAIGCVRKGVEGGCLLLRTLDGQTTYNIYATPRPEVDRVITIEGRPHTGPTSCMEGVAVDVTKWELSDQKCTEASMAERPWDIIRELKSGTELRIFKRGSLAPILAAMDDATDDRLLVVVKNEQMAIERNDIDRIDARPRSSRLTKESHTVNDAANGPTSVGPQPLGSRMSAPGGSQSTSIGVGTKPEFETIYRRAAK